VVGGALHQPEGAVGDRGDGVEQTVGGDPVEQVDGLAEHMPGAGSG
jgi:hypothetical protein